MQLCEKIPTSWTLFVYNSFAVPSRCHRVTYLLLTLWFGVSQCLIVLALFSLWPQSSWIPVRVGVTRILSVYSEVTSPSQDSTKQMHAGRVIEGCSFPECSVHYVFFLWRNNVAQKIVDEAVNNRRTQRSGMIVKRAIQIVIKSGPRVIIRAWSQRNWEQRGECLRNILLTNNGISHATDSSMTRICYVPFDGQWICPFDEHTDREFTLQTLREIRQSPECNFVL